ncbi:hypothetical protein [Arcobacter roscoffensis]|uniref:Uncharacterized protein n=1 Tax=Arcobacter roscoffensis TaxID=2961520 RepID=A0ABY5E521_9BACT|nr:hypothetical protein [Arcobacter roscoffensis]UTJ06657.1 hypothetical protein NJU99_00780 [Arcobacter roscoffensis]
MAYFVASIIAVTSAMIIILTRYEADDSTIKAELEEMRVMFELVDGYVNTYIQAGESLSTLSFNFLNKNGFLLEGSTVEGTGFASTVKHPNKDDVVWQIIPTKDHENNSYSLMVNMSGNAALMSKARFSESFIGREFCEKALFGKVNYIFNTHDTTNKVFTGTGTNSDGFLVCEVHK